MTLLGAGLLWFGWFGFNGGSALAADGTAVLALVNSQLAAAAGAVVWLAIDLKRWKKGGSLGYASGFVAALATITPAAGFVSPQAALVIGVVAALVCYCGVMAKERFHYDDTLDAFGIHGVGGIAGTLMLGLFAQKLWNPAGANGLFAHNAHFFMIQLLAVAVTGVYSVGVTFILLKVLNATVGLRVSADEEHEGLDTNVHGEEGYSLGASAGGNSQGRLLDDSTDEERYARPAMDLNVG
jgi:Amt family ammonium transporter